MTNRPSDQTNEEAETNQPATTPDPTETQKEDQPGQKPGSPVTGGEGSQGAGGPAGFGTAD